MEVENLRTALGTSNAELATIQTQLATVKKEKMKIENEKMVGERSARKEVEELSDKLEDATFELEDWRRSGDGGGKEEVEKVKKAAKADLKILREKLEKEVERKSKVVEDLEGKVARLEEAEAIVETERKAKAELERTVSSSDQAANLQQQVETLNGTIKQLETDLAAARSDVTSSSSILVGKTIRKLQRELDSARRDNRALEEQIDELHERNHALTTRVPLPDSPSLTPVALPSMDIERFTSLEIQVLTLESELEQQKFASQEEIRGLEKQLDEANKELEAARIENRHVKAAFDVFQGEMEVCPL